MNYIEASRATAIDLRSHARLYLYSGSCLYVARIGNNEDWAAYKGSIIQDLDSVADYGVKIPEKEATQLFPVCGEAKLSYRR